MFRDPYLLPVLDWPVCALLDPPVKGMYLSNGRRAAREPVKIVNATSRTELLIVRRPPSLTLEPWSCLSRVYLLN